MPLLPELPADLEQAPGRRRMLHGRGHAPDLGPVVGARVRRTRDRPPRAQATAPSSILRVPAARSTTHRAPNGNARFRKPVKPGDQLRIEVETLFNKRGIWSVAGKTYVGETLVTEAELKATLADK